jgi:mannose-6-phosphate isomerase-like protein (cupin superfamily)
MKRANFAVLVSAAGMAAFAGLLAGQQQGKQQAKGPAGDSNGVVYAEGATIAEALAKGGAALAPRAAMVSRNADHLVAGGRRDKGGDAERHEKAYDIVYITDGEATYVTGGTLKGSRQTGPGEMLGGTIEGGETHRLKKGDVIVVPPGVPHWWKDTQGVTYMIIKVNKP